MGVWVCKWVGVGVGVGAADWLIGLHIVMNAKHLYEALLLFTLGAAAPSSQ